MESRGDLREAVQKAIRFKWKVVPKPCSADLCHAMLNFHRERRNEKNVDKILVLF